MSLGWMDRETFRRRVRRKWVHKILWDISECGLPIGDAHMADDVERFRSLVEREALALLDRTAQLKKLPAGTRVIPFALHSRRVKS